MRPQVRNDAQRIEHLLARAEGGLAARQRDARDAGQHHGRRALGAAAVVQNDGRRRGTAAPHRLQLGGDLAPADAGDAQRLGRRPRRRQHQDGGEEGGDSHVASRLDRTGLTGNRPFPGGRSPGYQAA